jgi:hypothetical protein
MVLREYSQKLRVINPNKENTVSPPPDALTDLAKVAADSVLNVTKKYSIKFRTPALRTKQNYLLVFRNPSCPGAL